MAIKNRQFIKDLLEKQIIEDAQQGDTTVLAEIISQFTDEMIFNWLSDKNQSLSKNDTQSDILLKITEKK